MSRVRVVRRVVAQRQEVAVRVPVREATMDTWIDGVLAEWHDFRATYRHGRGHRSVSSSGAERVVSASYHDWANGAHDEHRDRQRLKTIDEAMEAVRAHSRPMFLGLQAQARCLATDVCVYLVPGLPRDLPELDVLLQEARNRFARECIARKID